MNDPSRIRGPDIKKLYALFPPGDDMPEYEFVPSDEVPQPYHGLLVHEHHMTVTVEKHHGDLVDVQILERRHNDEFYARKILLALQGNRRVVQFGIMRVYFRYLAPDVRQEIVAGRTPLGRILIHHDVLRRIEPTAFLRIVTTPAMMKWFGLEEPRLTYGRLALIHCNEQPAVELLEIVAPE
jgi:chorismate-pyruvate lyase